jgi:hypothetical protein
MSNSPVFPFAARLPPGTPIRSAGYQWLEPYEGKLSRTVLRGGRAGNSSLPLDQAEKTRIVSEDGRLANGKRKCLIYRAIKVNQTFEKGNM